MRTNHYHTMLTAHEKDLANASMATLGRNLIRLGLLATLLGALATFLPQISIRPSAMAVAYGIAQAQAWVSSHYVIPFLLIGMLVYAQYLMQTRIAILNQLALREHVDAEAANYARDAVRPLQKLEKLAIGTIVAGSLFAFGALVLYGTQKLGVTVDTDLTMNHIALGVLCYFLYDSPLGNIFFVRNIIDEKLQDELRGNRKAYSSAADRLVFNSESGSVGPADWLTLLRGYILKRAQHSSVQAEANAEPA